MALWLWGPVGVGAPAPQLHRQGGEPRSAPGVRLGAVIWESVGLPAGREGSSVRHALICTNGETLSFVDLIKGEMTNFNSCISLLMLNSRVL